MNMTHPSHFAFILSLATAAAVAPLACAGNHADASASDSSGGSTGSNGDCPSASLVGPTLGLTLQFLNRVVEHNTVCNYGPQAGTTTVTIIYQSTTPADFAAEWAPSMQPGAQFPVSSLSGLGDAAVYSTVTGPSGPGTTVSVLKGNTEVEVTAPAEFAPVEALARQLIAAL